MMMTVTQFGEAGSSNIFTALGIDWQMLIFQIIGFLVLVFVMSKYVYPPLIKSIDERQAKIEAGNKAANAAEEKMTQAKVEVEKMLKEARIEASGIVSTAKEEAVASIEAAESKAKTRAEKIVADARDQLEKDVLAAKKALHNETLNLVADATEKIVGKTVNARIDKDVIATAVKEAR